MYRLRLRRTVIAAAVTIPHLILRVEEEDPAALQDILQAKRDAADRKAREAAQAALEWKPKAMTIPNNNNNNTINGSHITIAPGSDGAQALGGQGKPFQRVDSDYWGTVAANEGRADNSYDHAFGENGYGARSSEKLLRVRGKDFTREKNKRKRSFNGFSRTGGQIDADQSYSTKFTYSDDDAPN